MKKHRNYIAPLLLIIAVFLLILFTKSGPPIVIPQENMEETQHWKTYSNEEFKFSFKYPDGLLSNFTEDRIGSTTRDLLNRTSEINKQNMNSPNSAYQYNVHFGADAWKYDGDLDKFVNERLPETKGLKRKKVIFTPTYFISHTSEVWEIEQGIRISNEESDEKVYFVYNIFKEGNIIYNFALFSDDPVLIDANLPLLESILTTARFK